MEIKEIGTDVAVGTVGAVAGFVVLGPLGAGIGIIASIAIKLKKGNS